MFLQYNIVQTDDMLPFVMLEQLQGSARVHNIRMINCRFLRDIVDA